MNANDLKNNQMYFYAYAQLWRQCAEHDLPQLYNKWKYLGGMSEAILKELNDFEQNKYQNQVIGVGPLFNTCLEGHEMKLSFQVRMKEKEFIKDFDCNECKKTFMCCLGYLRCDICKYRVCKTCTNKEPDVFQRIHIHPLTKVMIKPDNFSSNECSSCK